MVNMATTGPALTARCWLKVFTTTTIPNQIGLTVIPVVAIYIATTMLTVMHITTMIGIMTGIGTITKMITANPITSIWIPIVKVNGIVTMIKTVMFNTTMVSDSADQFAYNEKKRAYHTMVRPFFISGYWRILKF